MIYKNNSTINEWYFNDQELIKVYKNGAICYYKIVQGATPSQEPCFAVVDNIQSYSDTEFIDVYDKATEKWYKLNNLDQYEQYGVYGEGRNITYYEGKLTIDNGYEYEWDGSQWDNLGEVSGSTATLPDVPFTVNINAKNYNATTKTFAKTNGQLADTDIVITEGTPVLNDGYVTVSTGSKGTISGYGTYFTRDNNNPNLTIISKQSTVGGCHIFSNRDSNYNWMYRAYNNKLSLHGANGEIGNLAVTTQPVIESVRVNSSRTAIFNNYTDNTTVSSSDFNYGGSNTTAYLFYGGYSGEYFVGDFYWLYMSQTTLTDEQVQQVITYNEGEATSAYPKYYTEKDEPENDVVFTDMEDALAYQCPWVGMDVTIDNTPYLFGDAYEWLTKYGLFEVSGEYICDSGDKYKEMEEMVRNVDGTWSHQTPIVYEKGDLIEADSPDCDSRLPDGYTEVEYIRQSSSYLRQNVAAWTIPITNMVNGDSFTIIFSMDSTGQYNTSKYISIFGSNEVFAIRNDRGYSYGLNTAYFKYNLSNASYTMEYNTKLSFNYKPSLLTITNVATGVQTLISLSYSRSYSPSGNLGVYGYWYGGTNEYLMRGNIYEIKIEGTDDTLKYDYIPCKRDSDNKVGLYDIVNGLFTSPSGFRITAGPDVQ